MKLGMFTIAVSIGLGLWPVAVVGIMLILGSCLRRLGDSLSELSDTLEPDEPDDEPLPDKVVRFPGRRRFLRRQTAVYE